MRYTIRPISDLMTRRKPRVRKCRPRADGWVVTFPSPHGTQWAWRRTWREALDLALDHAPGSTP